ncbi:MAG: hypothetical protein KBA51_07630 [Kiritimatiellae bacterium]|nr:hypothetical protein [Kiritimatiellia bacterium]
MNNALIFLLGTQEGLYFINYLTNIRIQDPVAHTEQPMFTIILAGNPQLNEIIHNHPSLVQRIQMMYHLEPFTAAQTTEYVRHHIAAVGGDPGAFHPDALESIFKYSGGLPRKINTLCDTALMLGFAARAPQVSAEIVNQAATDTGVFSPQAVPPKESDR